MEEKELFELSLKKLTGFSDECFTYKLNKREYKYYFSNDEFEKFKKEMENKYPSAFSQYNQGNGGELKPKVRNNIEVNPPKMASVASSSRFIYLSLRDNQYIKLKKIISDIDDFGDFYFERKIKIKNQKGFSPNLDGAYLTNNKGVYIEAKCQEVFNSHNIYFRETYFRDGVLFGNADCSFGLNESMIDYGKNLIKKEVFGFDENEELFFEFAQFIRHLLGIANTNHKSKELIYLLFKPKALFGFEKRYKKIEEQFKKICESEYVSNYCKKHCINIRLVYAINNSMYEEFEPYIVEEFIYSK